MMKSNWDRNCSLLPEWLKEILFPMFLYLWHWILFIVRKLAILLFKGMWQVIHMLFSSPNKKRYHFGLHNWWFWSLSSLIVMLWSLKIQPNYQSQFHQKSLKLFQGPPTRMIHWSPPCPPSPPRPPLPPPPSSWPSWRPWDILGKLHYLHSNAQTMQILKS